MKRICLIVLCLFTLCCCFGCASEAEVSVDSIKEKYDPSVYHVMDYTEEQISDIEKKLTAPSGFNLKTEGGIAEVVHIVNNNTAPPELEWTYVYRFEVEEDAKLLEENRKDYTDGIENGKCLRFGKIVVFGNSEVIDSIGG